VFARRTPQGWVVELNPSALPRVRLNEGYAAMITRAPDHAVLRTQLQEARWLVRSLEIRNETMLKVARTIVERQQAFLDRGEESMQPMILKDVAEAVGMHESTISRVTTGKYLHTPRGVFEFRFFFSSQVAGEDGAGVSSTAIRAKIEAHLAGAAGRPLSDQQLVELLAADGVQVARRTGRQVPGIARHRALERAPPGRGPLRAGIHEKYEEDRAMQLKVTGHHVEVTPPLREYVRKKLDRVLRHFERVVDVHCVLTVEKLEHKAEATLGVSGAVIHADAKHEDMYAAIDALADKLDRMIRKHKEKISDHHAAEVARGRPA
jgi:ribosomal subunit interface protein